MRSRPDGRRVSLRIGCPGPLARPPGKKTFWKDGFQLFELNITPDDLDVILPFISVAPFVFFILALFNASKLSHLFVSIVLIFCCIMSIKDERDHKQEEYARELARYELISSEIHVPKKDIVLIPIDNADKTTYEARVNGHNYTVVFNKNFTEIDKLIKADNKSKK